MIVRDDSERGIPPLVTHQPPSSLDDAPVIRGRMVQIPGWIHPAVRRIIYRARLVWRRAVASPGTAANAALAGGACGASAVNRCRRGRAKDAAAGGKSQRARGAGSGQRYAAASALQRPCLRLATGKAQHCIKRQSVDGGRFTPCRTWWWSRSSRM